MAVRSASRRYSSLRAFLEDWQSTMRLGAITLPPGTITGEPANEMKIDLVMPVAGRLGPIEAQLLHVLPDGTVALRVVEWPPAVKQGMDAVFETIQDLRRWFVESGQLTSGDHGAAGELERLRRRVKQLESRPQTVVVQGGDGQQTGSSGRAIVAYDDQGKPIFARGLPVPDVSGLAPTLAGKLGDRSLRDAVMELAMEHVTGLLTVRYTNGKTRWGFWHRGGPVGFRTEPIGEDEVLGVLLFRAGQLKREQLEQSLNLMETTGVRQGEALVEMGVFTFAQLVLLLQKQCEFIFQRVVKESGGEWAFHVLESLPERFVAPPLRAPSLLFRALRTHAKDLPAEELANTLRPWLDRYVYFVPGAERLFQEMKLGVDEQGFLKIVASTSYRLRELFSVSNLPRSNTAGMVWTLADLHLVEFRDEEALARGVERNQRVLEDRKRAVTRGTLFDALDLHWICTSDEVEAAWRKIDPEYGPESYGRWGEPNRKLVDELYGKLKEAYERLRADGRRREYRAEVMERMQIDQSAEMLGKKGEMAFMKENAREAFDCYSKAVELVPNNGEYQAGLSRARTIARGT